MNGNGKLNELDRLALAAGQAVKSFHGGDEGMMVQLLSPIEEHAPTLRATTPQGALFHLLLAAADLGCLVGTTNWPEDDLRKIHQRIEGCIVSAINVFERECGLKREDFGGEYFARRSYVPEVWTTGPDSLAPDGGRR